MLISRLRFTDFKYHNRSQQKYKIEVIAFVILLTFMSGCDLTGSDSEEDTTPVGEMRELSAKEQVLVNGTNDFTFDILQKVAEGNTEESFFLSPFSISMAFGMALNGSAGDTYSQLRDFFGHDGLTNDEINKAFRDIIRLLTQLDPQVRMEIANSVWYREGFEVIQKFLETNEEYFDAEISELDFNDPGAPDIINEWISDKTNGLIDKMIEDIGSDVVMYLINAIYFKADWSVQFDPDDTRDRPFTTGSGEQIDVPMMWVKEGFRYYRNDDWQVVDLEYGEGDFSFTAFLPAESDNLSEFAESLTRQEFESITSQLHMDTIQVYMPRFEINFDYNKIMNDLVLMGLTLPFDGSNADFSRINKNVPLHVSNVKHRAVIKVDEEGSEAAAVTVVTVEVTSAGPSQPIIRLNRPFLFFIRENSSNTILFMGKYAGDE